MFQQISDMLAVYFKYLNTFTIYSLFSWEPFPPSPAAVWVSSYRSTMLESPFCGPMSSSFWLYCFICWSTYSSNTLSRSAFFELWCVWNIFILPLCLNEHLGENWIICSSFWRHFWLNWLRIHQCLCSKSDAVLISDHSKRPGYFLWKHA